MLNTLFVIFFCIMIVSAFYAAEAMLSTVFGYARYSERLRDKALHRAGWAFAIWVVSGFGAFITQYIVGTGAII